jgi:hypothetical protein
MAMTEKLMRYLVHFKCACMELGLVNAAVYLEMRCAGEAAYALEEAR